ncbi:hypothetical protein V1289_008176 [Bradyrhizobium sp. AZCC 2289]
MDCFASLATTAPLPEALGPLTRNNSQQTCFCKRVATRVVDGRLMLTDGLLNRRP